MSEAARPRVEIVNFGCRLNLVEGEVMRRAALAAGRDNLVIVNTCAVTAEAARQARQTIRRLKREAPEREIIVTGCAAQIDPRAFAAMPEVAKVLGNAREDGAARLLPVKPERASASAIFLRTPPAPPSVESIEGPYPRLPRGAEWLRSSLHLLHHSLWARRLALHASGRSSCRGRKLSSAKAFKRSC